MKNGNNKNYYENIFSLFRNIIGFRKAGKKNLCQCNLSKSKMRGQLNIFVFDISQNPNITRLSAVFYISKHGYTTGIYILSNLHVTAKYFCIK